MTRVRTGTLHPETETGLTQIDDSKLRSLRVIRGDIFFDLPPAERNTVPPA